MPGVARDEDGGKVQKTQPPRMGDVTSSFCCGVRHRRRARKVAAMQVLHFHSGLRTSLFLRHNQV